MRVSPVMDGISWKWALGVSLGLLASLLAVLSKAFMKKSDHIDSRQGPGTSASALFMAMGVGLMLSYPPLTVLSFAFGPQSVVSVTVGTASFFHTAFAPCILGQHRTAHDKVGALLVLVGCVGVLVLGPHNTPQYESDQLLLFITAPRCAVFVVCAALWIGLLAALCCLPVEYASHHKSIGLKQKQVAWGCIGGSVGGFWVFLKACTSMMGQGAAWTHPQAYLILLAAIGTSLAGVLILNEGLCRYGGTLITPTYQANMIAMGVASGAVFFQELDQLTVAQIVGFVVSVVLVCIGTCTCLLAEATIKPYRAERSYGLSGGVDANDEPLIERDAT